MSAMDRLEEEIQTAIDDAKGDFPEVGEHDVVWEIVNNMTIGHSLAVRREMLGRFGFNPDW
jgi:hypothetical protein